MCRKKKCALWVNKTHWVHFDVTDVLKLKYWMRLRLMTFNHEKLYSIFHSFTWIIFIVIYRGIIFLKNLNNVDFGKYLNRYLTAIHCWEKKLPVEMEAGSNFKTNSTIWLLIYVCIKNMFSKNTWSGLVQYDNAHSECIEQQPNKWEAIN